MVLCRIYSIKHTICTNILGSPTRLNIGPNKLTLPPTLYMMPECLGQVHVSSSLGWTANEVNILCDLSQLLVPSSLGWTMAAIILPCSATHDAARCKAFAMTLRYIYTCHLSLPCLRLVRTEFRTYTISLLS